jgi:hypothetical protein
MRAFLRLDHVHAETAELPHRRVVGRGVGDDPRHLGRIVESGPTEQVLSNPSDAYTIKLLESVPRAETDWLAGHGALSPDRAAR